VDLASFKTSILDLGDDELMALLADIRTSRRPITDITDIKERAKPKARTSSSGKTSVASIKATLSSDQIRLLIEKLAGGS
jgi:hypothetical protein